MSLDTFRVEGEYSFISDSTTNIIFGYAFTHNPKNVSAYMSNGYLSFYLYVIDLDLLGDVVYVEMTSSGTCDQQEITCDLKPYITEEGWNHVLVPISNFYASGSGTFNPASFNFFRIYTLGSNCHLYLDYVKLVK